MKAEVIMLTEWKETLRLMGLQQLSPLLNVVQTRWLASALVSVAVKEKDGSFSLTVLLNRSITELVCCVQHWRRILYALCVCGFVHLRSL